jgi:hypothetical protein
MRRSCFCTANRFTGVIGVISTRRAAGPVGTNASRHADPKTKTSAVRNIELFLVALALKRIVDDDIVCLVFSFGNPTSMAVITPL